MSLVFVGHHNLELTDITSWTSPSRHTLTPETSLSVDTSPSMFADCQIGALVVVNFTPWTHPIRWTVTNVRAKCVLTNAAIETWAFQALINV